MATTGISVA
jgi:uncharacterized protein YjbJ (UPF0337 family)